MITLVLGGTRSGKSLVAERIAAELAPPVTYVATLAADDGDRDLQRRIEEHRCRRPAEWKTLECDHTDLAGAIGTLEGSILVDSLGGWVARSTSVAVGGAGGRADGDVIDARGVGWDGDALCSALRYRKGDTVVVSEEVGMAVHPTTRAGRLFSDRVGALNQEVAEIADEVLLVVAGRVLRLSA